MSGQPPWGQLPCLHVTVICLYLQCATPIRINLACQIDGLPTVFATCVPAAICRLIKNCGFGHATASTCPQNSLQQVLLDAIEGKAPSDACGSTSDTSTKSMAPAGSITAVQAGSEAAAAVASRTKGFLNRLLNTLNWTLTEFTVCVGDLHNLRGRRSILEAQNQYRRTGLMFELSVNFMRILEFTVVSWDGFSDDSVSSCCLSGCNKHALLRSSIHCCFQIAASCPHCSQRRGMINQYANSHMSDY